MNPEEHRSSHVSRQVLAIALAAGATAPALALRLSGTHPEPLIAAAIYGLGVVGSAFLLAWAAEALQLDVAKGLSLALIALIAVLPEYAVDFVFTWKAGKDPDRFAPLALANMTGGNRLLIGVGWTMVVLIGAYRIRKATAAGGYAGPVDTGVKIERPHSIDVAYLAVATIYSLSLPLKRSITLFDAAFLVALFVAYMIRVSGAPAGVPHLVGPAELIGSLPKQKRRLTVLAMLVFAAGVILVAAEPFAEGLVETGSEFGISEFLLVQWLAPIASEAPELLIAGLFAWRLDTSDGLGALLSSKVNQWTLLVGTLPIAFALSSSTLHGLPLDSLQREELFLTAAQSAFAVAILVNLEMSVKEAYILGGLFVSQFFLGAVLPEDVHEVERIGVGIMYLVLAAGIILRNRAAVPRMARDGFTTPHSQLIHEATPHRPSSYEVPS